MRQRRISIYKAWTTRGGTGDRRRYIIRKQRFVEISEAVRGIDNKSPAITIVRLFVRHLTRAVGYAAAARVIGAILRLRRFVPKTGRNRYILYLLEINRLRLEYMDRLSSSELYAAVRKKNEWAELVLKESRSVRARWDAKGYLSLLARYGFHDLSCARPPSAAAVASERKFYMYGPNAARPPSTDYSDFTLVVTKPITADVSAFDRRILFLNSIYYREVVCPNEKLRADITAKYDRVYVSCRQSPVQEPFVRSKFPMGDSIAGAQGLGRVLYNLRREHGTFTCVIEGFDFYLGRTPFALYYPTLLRDEQGTLSEQGVCHSLADHDALYNFLYVKHMIEDLNVMDSVEFKRIIELDGREYLEALAKARNFGSLRQA